MARKLRIEIAGGFYHALNRGNYRQPIFADDGTRRAFLKCVAEACERGGCKAYALAIMLNHFHLAMQTPEPNLSETMHWLETTFSVRFNKYRGEHGHVFQGRYKAFPVEVGPPLGAVCHYIHLNPVRAGLVSLEDLGRWQWSSYRWIVHPSERPEWFDPTAALSLPGCFQDDRIGRRHYREYLAWLLGNPGEQKKLGFHDMEKGWAFGSNAFKAELLASDYHKGVAMMCGSPELAEARDICWTASLARLIAQLDPGVMQDAKKSADWRVAIAAVMKQTTTAPNAWIARELQMGDQFFTSRLASECRRGLRAQEILRRLTAKSMT